MTPTTPERFAQLARCLDTGEPMPDDLRAWLSEAVQAYHSGASLPHAFQLTEPHRRRQRDRALVAAAECIAPNMRRWPQSAKLLRAVNTFAWSFWAPRLPAAWPELTGSRLHLCRAFSSGLDIPRSQRQLHTILTENGSAFIAENSVDTLLHPFTATG